MPLTIVAHIEAEADQVDFIKLELLKLKVPTLAEEGCLQYDLHQDNEAPEKFLYFEKWENRDLWQAHMQSAHLEQFGKATEGKIKSAVIQEMSFLDSSEVL